MYAPSSNRLTSRPQGPVTADGAGHTTAQAGFSYTWDGAGRLKTVRLSGTLLATYHYDAGHRRTRKETTAQAPQGAATVLYSYDRADHLIAETDSTGPIRSYVWRDDVPVAQIEHRPTRKVLYFETDHLNTPRAARNEAGVLVWRWEVDAFGSSLPDEDPDGDGQPTTVNLRYPGQVFDPESGLHYNLARYYDPTSGRYLSPDPIGLAGGVNTYAYVGNNPLRYVDPFGLCRVDVRFARLGPNWYHAYIVTTDTDGSQMYYRGGPTPGMGGPSSGATGAIGSGTGGTMSGSSGSNSSGASNSSNSSSPGSGRGGTGRNNGPWGSIFTNYGSYGPNTPDWDPGTPPSVNMLDNNEPCGCNAGFAQTLKNIQKANIPYNPFSTNSNAVVRETLERNDFVPPVPPVWVPGWGTPLPR